MTPNEITGLIDLSITDELPEGLRTAVDSYLAAHPDAARDAQSLRAAIIRLRSLPSERPDRWFVERTLDGLLREDSAERPHTIAATR